MNKPHDGLGVNGEASRSTPPCSDVSLSLIQDALRFLLIRYAQVPSRPLAAVIMESLEALLAHPEFRPPWAERCAYRRLLMHWRLRCACMGP